MQKVESRLSEYIRLNTRAMCPMQCLQTASTTMVSTPILRNAVAPTAFIPIVKTSRVPFRVGKAPQVRPHLERSQPAASSSASSGLRPLEAERSVE